MVEVQGITIKKSAKILKINYSTAKHIIKQHKIQNPDLSQLNNFML
jgi:transposase